MTSEYTNDELEYLKMMDEEYGAMHKKEEAELDRLNKMLDSEDDIDKCLDIMDDIHEYELDISACGSGIYNGHPEPGFLKEWDEWNASTDEGCGLNDE